MKLQVVLSHKDVIEAIAAAVRSRFKNCVDLRVEITVTRGYNDQREGTNMPDQVTAVVDVEE